MALTATEKVKIVTDLGWPAKTVIDGSIHYSNWVDDRLTDLTPEIEACVRDLLSRLEKMDAKLEKATCRVSVKQVDGITFRDDEIRILRRERWRIIGELSDMLDIPAKSRNMGSVCV